MERLWSPWRMQYVSRGSSGGCIFCDHLSAGDDESARILYRAERSFVILNAFPYNSGHLMIAPNRHVAGLAGLAPEERNEIMDVTSRCTEILDDALEPEGFNIGLNIGPVAGAGVPDHVHVHVVPRWAGDTNFMPVVGETKVLPEMIADTDAKLRPLFGRMG